MAITPRPIITKELIYSHINSLDIFQYYCSNFKKIGELFRSELRNDKNASCQIDWIRGDLMYSDFGDIKGIRAIEYVMLKYNLKFYDALEKIYYEFKLDGRKNTLIQNDSFNRVNKLFIYSKSTSTESDKQFKPTTIRIKRRGWQKCDKQYWYDRYSIRRETLEKFNVSPISHFWIDSRKLNNQMFVADALSYCYTYYWENNILLKKIYQPNRNGIGKWWSNNTNRVVQGEGMLPKQGELLVITKSLKDVMAMYEMNLTAISPTNEETFLPEQYLLKQQSRFKRIVLMLDQDSTGIRKSKEFSEKWNIPYILIPEEYGIKDISDYVHSKGIDAAKKLMKNLL